MWYNVMSGEDKADKVMKIMGVREGGSYFGDGGREGL